MIQFNYSPPIQVVICLSKWHLMLSCLLPQEPVAIVTGSKVGCWDVCCDGVDSEDEMSRSSA